MAKYIIKGGTPLKGKIQVKGAKNHVLKMIPASLLTNQPTVIRNAPDILDVRAMVEIVKSLGGEITFDKGEIKINPTITSNHLPKELVAKLRASFLFIIPLLHKFNEVIFPHPGGDDIGRRPIDMTLDFLKNMGAEVVEESESFKVITKGLKGINFTFKWVSVTGTEALVMAAVLAEGVTVAKNVALEPEVIALCEYLNSVGAKIEGIGTTTLKITGVKTINGGSCEIIPDRIETGTFAILGALAGESITITNCNPDHLDVLWKYFDLMSISYQLTDTTVEIKKSENIKSIEVKTHEYPGFPTDLQPPMTLLLTQANGISIMHETIYDGRLFYTDKLTAMGAHITMADPHRVIVQGKTNLYGKYIGSPDVRAGIALVMAGIIGKGTTEVTNIYHVQRGYEDIVSRLNALGASITQVD